MRKEIYLVVVIGFFSILLIPSNVFASNLTADYNEIGFSSACSYYKLSYSRTLIGWMYDMVTLGTSNTTEVIGHFTGDTSWQAWEWQANVSYNETNQDCTTSCFPFNYTENSTTYTDTNCTTSCSPYMVTKYKMGWVKNNGANLNLYGSQLYQTVSSQGYLNVRFCSDFQRQWTVNGYEIALDHIPKFAGVDYPNYQWWNSSYTKYWNVTAVNSTYVDADYPLNFTLNATTDGGFGNYYRITVVNKTGSEIPFAFDDANKDGVIQAGDKIVFRVSGWSGSGSDQEYSVFYNCTACSSADAKNSSFNNIYYKFWDEFDNSTNLVWDKWTSTNKPMYKAGINSAGFSALNETALTDSSQFIQSLTNVTKRFQLWEMKMKFIGAGVTDTAYIDRGNITGGIYNTGRYQHWVTTVTGVWGFSYRTTADTTPSDAGTSTGVSADTTSVWTLRTIINATNTLIAELYDDGVLVWSAKYTNYKENDLYEKSFAWSSDNIQLDYIKVRTYSSPEPSGFFTGSGQSAGGADTTPPTYTNNGTNSTNPSPLDQVLYYANWTDNVGLSGYIFSWNATGALCNGGMVNDTWLTFGVGTWSNVTKQVPLACAGKVIDFLFFANDTSNNWNATTNMYETERQIYSPNVSQSISVSAAQLKQQTDLRNPSQSITETLVSLKKQSDIRKSKLLVTLQSLETEVARISRNIMQTISLLLTSLKKQSDIRKALQSISLSNIETEFMTGIKRVYSLLSLSSMSARVRNVFGKVYNLLSLSSMSARVRNVFGKVYNLLNLNIISIRLSSFARNPAQSIQIIQNISDLYGYIRLLAQSLSLILSNIKQQADIRLSSILIMLSSASNKLIAITKNLPQTLSFLLSTVQKQSDIRAIMQSMSLSNLATKLSSIMKSTTQILQLNTMSTRMQDIVKTAITSLNLQTFPTSISNFLRSTFQTIATSDIAARLSSFLAAVFQLINIEINTTRASSFYRSMMSLLDLQIMQTRLLSAVRFATGAIQIENAANIIGRIYDVAVSLLVSIIESVTRFPTIMVNILQGISVAIGIFKSVLCLSEGPCGIGVIGPLITTTIGQVFDVFRARPIVFTSLAFIPLLIAMSYYSRKKKVREPIEDAEAEEGL